MKITKLIIDENRWLRAGWNGGLNEDPAFYELPKHITNVSSLRDSKTERMCCLGFVSCAAGISKKDITNVQSLSGLTIKARAKIEKKFPWLLSRSRKGINPYFLDSAIATRLMMINDETTISLPQKRAKIKKIFKDNGVEVIFKR